MAEQHDVKSGHDSEKVLAERVYAPTTSCLTPGSVAPNSAQKISPLSQVDVPVSNVTPITRCRQQSNRQLSNNSFCSKQTNSHSGSFRQSTCLSRKSLPAGTKQTPSPRREDDGLTAQSDFSLNDITTPTFAKQNYRNPYEVYIPHQGYQQSECAQKIPKSQHSYSTCSNSLDAAPQVIDSNLTSFSGSSSGLAGLPFDYPKCTVDDIWTSQQHDIGAAALVNNCTSGLIFQPNHPSMDRSFGSNFTEDEGGNQPQSIFLNNTLRKHQPLCQQAVGADGPKCYGTDLPFGLVPSAMQPQRNTESLPFRTNFSMTENKYWLH